MYKSLRFFFSFSSPQKPDKTSHAADFCALKMYYIKNISSDVSSNKHQILASGISLLYSEPCRPTKLLRREAKGYKAQTYAASVL